MSLAPAMELLGGLKKAVAAIPIPADAPDVLLFDSVEIYPNKGLSQALKDLMLSRDRICLIVPMGFRYDHKEQGAGSILTKRFLLVDLLLADRAVLSGGIEALTGGPANVGVLAMSEILMNGISGKQLSNYGGVMPDDGAPLELTAKDARDLPGRIAWAQSILIPAGTVRVAVA